MNFNININENRNTLKTNYPKSQECDNNKVLYRVTFGYKSKISGDTIFPVTYENFDDKFQKETIRLNPGDLVKYTPQNQKDPNYNRDAIIKKSTNRYEKREAQSRGLEVNPDKDKNSFYDIEFINPIVGPNNQVIKIKNQISRLNKNGSVQLSKIQDEVESYVCEESFVPFADIENYINLRNRVRAGENGNNAALGQAENRLWNSNFHLDDNNQPQYPLMNRLNANLKLKLDRDVENMVKVGFLLGQKEQRPQIKKIRNGYTLSFLMPKGVKPGDTITVPITDGKKIYEEITIKIPITTGTDNHIPKINEYLKDIPIDKNLNSGNYDSLKKLKLKNNVDTEFKPTYIKAEDYVGPDTQKKLDVLVSPGSNQQYYITSAKIVPQNGNKFIFKKLTSFNKDSSKLIFDLYVIVDLTLNLKLKGPKEAADDTFGDKLSRTVTAGILNSSLNCPQYMKKAKLGASQLLTKIMPRTPIAVRIRRGIAARRRRRQAEGRDNRDRINRRMENIASGRENVRRGGRRTRRKKKRCLRKATKRLNKCWRKRKRKTFKKCWKKGRNKYKACKKKTKRKR